MAVTQRPQNPAHHHADFRDLEWRAKKKSVNFNSCCVSYAIKATLNEANQDHLQALEELKDQLVVKVQEALNGKAATNQTAN